MLASATLKPCLDKFCTCAKCFLNWLDSSGNSFGITSFIDSLKACSPKAALIKSSGPLIRSLTELTNPKLSPITFPKSPKVFVRFVAGGVVSVDVLEEFVTPSPSPSTSLSVSVVTKEVLSLDIKEGSISSTGGGLVTSTGFILGPVVLSCTDCWSSIGSALGGGKSPSSTNLYVCKFSSL